MGCYSCYTTFLFLYQFTNLEMFTFYNSPISVSVCQFRHVYILLLSNCCISLQIKKCFKFKITQICFYTWWFLVLYYSPVSDSFIKFDPLAWFVLHWWFLVKRVHYSPAPDSLWIWSLTKLVFFYIWFLFVLTVAQDVESNCSSWNFASVFGTKD